MKKAVLRGISCERWPLGKAVIRMNLRTQGAIIDLNAVLMLNPCDGYAVRARGFAKTQLDDFKVAAYQPQLSSVHKFPQRRSCRAAASFESCACMANQPTNCSDHDVCLQGAISDYDSALALDPADIEALAGRAQAKLGLGDAKVSCLLSATSTSLGGSTTARYRARARAVVWLWGMTPVRWHLPPRTAECLGRPLCAGSHVGLRFSACAAPGPR